MLPIDLSAYNSDLKIKKEQGKRWIFDPIRKKYLVLSPEEFVRQLLLQYLIQEMQYSPNRISIEKKLVVNGRERRFDLLIYDEAVRPFLLIECKAPEVKISQAVFEQIARYNMALRVPYLMVSNGLHNYCCQIDYERQSFDFLDALPVIS
ncbi:MAG: type I restriction enzyme HsdR N-terminal domain-containing protein [Bacteroidota bacterium]